MDTKTYFDRAVVISLKRSPQKLEAFQKQVAAMPWPFREVEVFDALDGFLLPVPPWFHLGPQGQVGGMETPWAIYRSHLAIIERAIHDRVQRLLVFEDDAEFVPDFPAKATAFLEALPSNAELVYLGGQTNHYQQNQHPHKQINAEVIQPWSCNRLHAYFLTFAGMRKAYDWLTRQNWQRLHHIDHHLERLSRSEGIITYAPTKWLVAQSASFSDILGQHMRRRDFTANGPQLPSILAVLGPYRGGTSATAGALHKLKIIMGHKFFQGREVDSPKGCFEAIMLYNLCMECYGEPYFQERLPYQQRVKKLHDWLLVRKKEAAVIGAKHPKLCLMVPEMLEAWPDCKFLAVDRPIAESVASLVKAGWWQPAMDPNTLIRRLVETRDRDLDRVDPKRVMRISFAGLMADKWGTLQRIAEFAEVDPPPRFYDEAVAHLDDGLKHFNAETCPAHPILNVPMYQEPENKATVLEERQGWNFDAVSFDTGTIGSQPPVVPKPAAAKLPSQPTPQHMTAIVTLNLNDFLPAIARESFQHTARRWGCAYIELTEPLGPCHHFWQKTLISECPQVRPYLRLLVLDSDMLIRSDCPNPFAIVPETQIGVVSRLQPDRLPHLLPGRPKTPNLDGGIEGIDAMGLKPYDTPDEHLNGGFVLYHPYLHSDILADWKQAGETCGWRNIGFADQAALSCILHEHPTVRHWLPWQFNACDAQRRFPPGPMQAYIYHFTRPREDMKAIAQRYTWLLP